MTIITPRGDEVVIRYLLVDAKHASDRLKNNEHNRGLSDKTAETYGRSMTEDDWEFTAETLTNSDTGDVIDGQHRYKAIVLSDKPQWMLEANGLPMRVQRYTGIGRRRSAADELRINGVRYAPGVAATARVLLMWQAWLNPKIRKVINPGNNETTGYYYQHADLIQDGWGEARKIYDAVGQGVSIPAIAAAHARARQRINDPFLVARFWHDVRTGDNTRTGEAAHALQHSMIRSQDADLIPDLRKVVVCLNAHLMGQPMMAYQAPRGGVRTVDIPDVVAINNNTEEDNTEQASLELEHDLTEQGR